MAENKSEGNGAGEKLLAQACKAYGIGPKFVHSSKYYPEEKQVVVCTAGGTRVRYREGDEKAKDFAPLTQVRVDGKVVKKPRHVVGRKKG